VLGAVQAGAVQAGAVPELPEIEVLRMGLEPWLVGETIDEVVIRNTALREKVDVRGLRSGTLGRRITSLGRRAKYLLVHLDGGCTLVVHLGMSGRLTLAAASRPVEKHEHASFTLSSGGTLRFRDPRRFGLLFVLPTADLTSDRHFSHLGVEPLEPSFDGVFLRDRCRGRRAPVKSFLMDARNVVGLGNIYVTEALYRAGVHPLRSVARISRLRWDRLAVSIQAVLEQAIAEGGTTLRDYRNAEGGQGYFQVSLAVYGREREECGACGRTIRRVVLAGRSTFYCPRCQR